MRKFTATLAALAMLANSQAAFAAGQCLSKADAESMGIALWPSLVDAVTDRCSGILPNDAALRNISAETLSRYEADADAEWPAALRALQSVMGGELPDELTPAAAKLLVPIFLNEEIAKEIKDKDCKSINTVYESLAPIPTRNVARLIIAIVEVSESKEATEDSPAKAPFCPE